MELMRSEAEKDKLRCLTYHQNLSFGRPCEVTSLLPTARRSTTGSTAQSTRRYRPISLKSVDIQLLRHQDKSVLRQQDKLSLHDTESLLFSIETDDLTGTWAKRPTYTTRKTTQKHPPCNTGNTSYSRAAIAVD
ncbi:hypothetical protein CHS0354_008928, partial [Potamilus streckersoni]